MEASTFQKGAATLMPTTGNSDVWVHLNDVYNFAESVGWTATENWSSRYGQGEACPPLLCKWHCTTSASLLCGLLNTHSWKVGWVFKTHSRITAVFRATALCLAASEAGSEINQHNTLPEKLEHYGLCSLAWELSGCILVERFTYSHYSGKVHIRQAVDRLPVEVQSPS